MRFCHSTTNMTPEIYYLAPLMLFVIRIAANLLKCGFYSLNLRFKFLKHEFTIVLHVRHKHGVNFRFLSKYIAKN